MSRRGVSGWMFLLVPAHSGRRGQRAVKRSCVCVCVLKICLITVDYIALVQVCWSCAMWWHVFQDHLNADVCLNSLNPDFLDNILLDNDVATAVNSTDILHQDCPVMDAHQTDHIYSRSRSDSASFSPPSVGSHASFYSYTTGSPPSHGLENSSLSSPSECASPLDGVTEDSTVQGLLTVVEPTAVLLQENIIHVVAGCDETVTDDSGLISVGRWSLLFCFNMLTKLHWMIYWYSNLFLLSN